MLNARRLTIWILCGSVLLLSGCMLRELIVPTPLVPAQMAANGAVLLEDALEDPELDEKDSSPIEVVADVVNSPATIFWTGISVQAALFWSLGDWILGGTPDFNKRIAQVTRWIGPRMASAPPPPPAPPSPTPTSDDWRRTRGTVQY